MRAYDGVLVIIRRESPGTRLYPRMPIAMGVPRLIAEEPPQPLGQRRALGVRHEPGDRGGRPSDQPDSLMRREARSTPRLGFETTLPRSIRFETKSGTEMLPIGTHGASRI